MTLALSAAPLAAASTATDKIDIASWDQADLYDGWTAEQLFDIEVRGSNDEDVGEIENLVVNADGKVTKVIVEAGGFLEIGDTHFAVLGSGRVRPQPGMGQGAGRRGQRPELQPFR